MREMNTHLTNHFHKGLDIMGFTEVFKPLVNKDGEALITYMGKETKEGFAGQTNPKTGVIYEQDWKIVSLLFEIKGLNEVQTYRQKISEAYSDDNVLGILLKGMGFVKPEVDLVEDDDGNLVPAFEEDEDGNLVPLQVIDLGAAIETFLAECIGKKFRAKFERETAGRQKGFLKMVVESIKPNVKPTK
jgi:hypothetical protein